MLKTSFHWQSYHKLEGLSYHLWQSIVKVFEYSPNKIKSSVSGFGHADKKMIHGAIEKILGQKIKCATHDESDALAIAIAHCIEVSNGSTVKKPGKSGFSRKSGSLAASINPKTKAKCIKRCLNDRLFEG